MAPARQNSISKIEFGNYKAFPQFSITLKQLNVLVGSNNCGKSTVIGALRLLQNALLAMRRRPIAIPIPWHQQYRQGIALNSSNLSVSLENVQNNYNDDISSIEFTLTNKNKLALLFPEPNSLYLCWWSPAGDIDNFATFRRQFSIDIRCVPTLGPVDSDETILTLQTVKRGLNTHRASSHFRNYWWHFPAEFEQFRNSIIRTWPGLDISPPSRRDTSSNNLIMFCQENRITREIYWAGFGFQIWCQLMTNIVRCSPTCILVADEPEIYLHADLQRQLVGILRDSAFQTLIATHSAEILGEADPAEVLPVDKTKKSARRLTDIAETQKVLDSIGSIHNIRLASLARNQHLIFVEGQSDFKRIRQFAKKMGFEQLSQGAGLTAIESGGFSSWVRLKHLASGVREVLGNELHIGAIFDRDYYPPDQIEEIKQSLTGKLVFLHFLDRKEMENYLLVPQALGRAVSQEINEDSRVNFTSDEIQSAVLSIMKEVAALCKADSFSQYLAHAIDFNKNKPIDSATTLRKTAEWFDDKWADPNYLWDVVPGKNCLSILREKVRAQFHVSLTDTRIINSIYRDEMPKDMITLLKGLDHFRPT